MPTISDYVNSIETADNVKNMRAPIADALQLLEENIVGFTIDSSPVENSNNPIMAKGVLSAIHLMVPDENETNTYFHITTMSKIISDVGTYYAYQDGVDGLYY